MRRLRGDIALQAAAVRVARPHLWVAAGPRCCAQAVCLQSNFLEF